MEKEFKQDLTDFYEGSGIGTPFSSDDLYTILTETGYLNAAIEIHSNDPNNPIYTVMVTATTISEISGDFCGTFYKINRRKEENIKIAPRYAAVPPCFGLTDIGRVC